MDTGNSLTLRPYTFRELLRRLFQIYGQNFVAFVALAAVVQIPLKVVETVVGLRVSDPLQKLLDRFNVSPNGPALVNPDVAMQMLSPLLEILLALLAVYVLSALIQTVLVSGPLAYITSESQLGRTASLGSALRALVSRAGTLVGEMSLYYTLLILLTVVLSFVLFACGLGVGLIVYLGVTVGAFLVPVAMLERGGVLSGLRRAWTLCKTRLWPVLGLIVGVALVSFVVSTALNAVEARYASANSVPAIPIILESLVGILIGPVLPVGFTLLYLDARVRSEGFDTALKRAQLTNPAASPADVLSPAPGPLMRNADFMNLGIVTMATFVVLLVYVGAIFLLSGGASGIMGQF